MVIKDLCFLSVIIFCFFSSVLFLKQSQHKRANTILAIIFLDFSFCIFQIYFKLFALQSQNFELLKYYIPASFFCAIIGPLIYLYLNEIYGIRLKIYSKWFLIQLLTTIPSVILSIRFILLSSTERIANLKRNYICLDWPTKLVSGFFFMQLTCYVLFGYFFLKKKQQQLEQNSNVLANSMSWLKNFFLFNIIFVPIIFALSILTGKDEYFMPLELITLIMQCFYIFAKSVWKSGIFAVEPKSLDKGDNITIRPKTQLLLIDEDLADKYIIDLEQVIRKKKLYLHSEFTIQDLANASSISLHHISNILNIRLQKSFPDFFNEFRIEHAKELLLDPESRKYTMEQIAKDCGFGSKSNFNICFKKHTKLTPTEYRKKVVSPES